MSELQLWLLGIGILIVIGVVAFNKWQEIQLKRRTERTFGPSHSDVLMDAPPSSVPREKAPKGRLQDTPADALSPTASMPNAEPVEHHLGLAPAEEPVAARGPILDARVDFTATITFSEPQNGEALLGLCDDVASASAKPVHWEGLRGNAWVGVIAKRKLRSGEGWSATRRPSRARNRRRSRGFLRCDANRERDDCG